MALPTIEKTWQQDPNKIVAASTSLAEKRALLRGIKDALLVGCKAGGGGLVPWTAVYSCDSVAAGAAGDAVDRWDADADLVWATAGSAHSWFVLKQTGIAANFQLLISCEGAATGGHLLTVAYSYNAGFTGGTTTARPTATDEIVVLNNGNWVNGNFTAAMRWTAQQSSDGQCTRIWIGAGGLVVGMWLLDKPKAPRATWTNPAICLVAGTGSASNYPTYANLGDFKVAARINTINALMAMTGEGGGSGTVQYLGQSQVAVDDLDLEWPMCPIGLYSATIGSKGRHAQVFDLWWGATTPAVGDSYPTGGTKLYAQVRDLIVPSGGVTLQFT